MLQHSDLFGHIPLLQMVCSEWRFTIRSTSANVAVSCSLIFSQWGFLCTFTSSYNFGILSSLFSNWHKNSDIFLYIQKNIAFAPKKESDSAICNKIYAIKTSCSSRFLLLAGGGFEDTGGAVALLLLMGSMGGGATEVAYGELTIDN